MTATAFDKGPRRRSPDCCPRKRMRRVVRADSREAKTLHFLFLRSIAPLSVVLESWDDRMQAL